MSPLPRRNPGYQASLRSKMLHTSFLPARATGRAAVERMNQQQGQPWDSRTGGAPQGQSRASVDYSTDNYQPHSTVDMQDVVKPRGVDGPAKGKAKKKSAAVLEDLEPKNKGEEAARSGRACLACRKLKVSPCALWRDRSLIRSPLSQTRCDGAEDPPCKRCRSGGHECVFVESKRGKRPARSVLRNAFPLSKSHSFAECTVNRSTTRSQRSSERSKRRSALYSRP